MKDEILIAGFGGQGILALGWIISEIAMEKGFNVSWLPSYGPEMRGGTANCTVIINKDPIISPETLSPSTLIALNKPSFLRFEKKTDTNALVIVNSSLVDEEGSREDVVQVRIPFNHLAEEIGSVRVVNMIALGVYMGIRFNDVSVEHIIEKSNSYFFKATDKMVEMNRQAIIKGLEEGKLFTEKLK